MTLQSFFDHYPRIRLASSQDQEALFRIIDETALASSQLQIVLDRKPDFYAFLKVQGEKSFVFTFHNKDGTPHGLACLTFRKMQWRGEEVCIGYASDLRTTPKLEREARLQWRKMFGEVLQHIHEIEDFEYCLGVITAVWAENKAAQAALVSQSRAKDFRYEPVHDYESFSIWGGWKLLSTPHSVRLRPLSPSEFPLLEKAFWNSGKGLSWQRRDMENTLRAFGKTFQDFQVLERNGIPLSLGMAVSQSAMKKVRIKSWPRSLGLVAQALPYFGLRSVQLNEPLEMRQLIFYRSLNGDPEENLAHFLQSLWRENRQKPRNRQFHILNYFHWNDLNDKESLSLLKRGFFSTKIKGSLYKVITDSTDPRFLEMSDFTMLEGNFL